MELLLFDRIEKIKQINEEYDLENNAYIAFSGGKDSTVLSYLVDLALPNNNIPRVFINTGIEYIDMIKFVKEMASNDPRIVMVKPTKNISKVLREYGYPMKSKQHSHNLAIYQNSGITTTIEKYIKGISIDKDGNEVPSMFKCPKKLLYQFTPEFKLKVSEKCCMKLKKEPMKQFEKESGKTIALTGMRREEGGQRSGINCIVTEGKKLKKFHPLAPVNDQFMEWFITTYNIKLCKLYYPPYNFVRLGCRACPYALNLKNELAKAKELLPYDYKASEYLWKPVYDEYRRIGYRLDKKEVKQISIYDLLDEDEEKK